MENSPRLLKCGVVEFFIRLKNTRKLVFEFEGAIPLQWHIQEIRLAERFKT